MISWIRGVRAEANPWGGRTLEWTTPSPVPLVNFERPVVVTAGPYDYGMGGARAMGSPAIAGAGVDEAVAVPHVPHNDPVLRGSMARWGTATMITSWSMFALALYAGYVYLDALNTQGAFRGGEATPTRLGTVLLTVGALAGALVWSWGYRRSRDGDGAPVARAAVAIGWIISLAGLIASVLIFLNYRAPLPLHAYASSMGLFMLFHGWHLVIAVVIGLIPLGRLFRGRIGGREYTIQCVGWWLWYTAVTAVAMMVLTLAIK